MNYPQAARMYKMLANPRRLAIISYLNKSKKATVTQVADRINLSLNAASKHLQLLKTADIVDSKQISLEQYYYLVDKNDIFIRHALSII